MMSMLSSSLLRTQLPKSQLPPIADLLQPKSIRKDFPARSLLPTVQEGWRIETGFVRTLSYLEDGTLVPLGVWGPGDTVGLPRLGTPQQVECLTKVSALLAAIADDRQVNEILLAHLQQAQELMLIRSHPRIELMLIKLLGWLGRRFGRTVDRGQLLELRLTHQDIAELLGATRVTITRTLHQLEQQGLIERLSLRQILLHEWETWHYEI